MTAAAGAPIGSPGTAPQPAVAPQAVPPPAAGVTVRPAPRREPPYDDELPGRHLHLVHEVGAVEVELPFPSDGAEAPTAMQPAPWPAARSDLPDPARWGRTLTTAILESLAGRRPLRQLAAHLSPAVLRGLRMAGEDTSRGGRAWARAATVRSVHVCAPADGVAEIAVVVATDVRVRALAARLEGRDGRWRCTRLNLG